MGNRVQSLLTRHRAFQKWQSALLGLSGRIRRDHVGQTSRLTIRTTVQTALGIATSTHQRRGHQQFTRLPGRRTPTVEVTGE